MKSMNFKQITKINFFSVVFSCIVALALGVGGYGVWALAAQLVALNFMKALFAVVFRKLAAFVLFRLGAYPALSEVQYQTVVGNAFRNAGGQSFASGAG